MDASNFLRRAWRIGWAVLYGILILVLVSLLWAIGQNAFELPWIRGRFPNVFYAIQRFIQQLLMPVVIAILAAAIGGWIVSRRSARHLETAAIHIKDVASLLHDQLVEDIQPMLHMKLHTQNEADQLFEYRYSVAARDFSKPARLLGSRLEVTCGKHDTHITENGPDISDDSLLSASGSYPFTFKFFVKCYGRDCTLQERFVVRYKDYRGLRVYEQDEFGNIEILETRSRQS